VINQRLLIDACRRPPRTLLELGSGGGNNASHLKARFAMTLVDSSPGMLEHSRRLNPGCEHVQGDMRHARLGREFDAVFVYDAVSYMTTETDLRAAIATAFVHCRPGGAALLVPDHVRETSHRQRITADMTATGSACATSNGRGIRMGVTRPTRSTTRTCSANGTERRVRYTTGTSRGCSRGATGCAGWRRRASSQPWRRSNTPS